MSTKPTYIEFGGRATAPPPFASTEGHFQGLLLEGDAGLIRTLCDRMLSGPAAPSVVYRPALGKYVMLFTGAYGSVVSKAPGFENWGSVKETQISLWVPVQAGHMDGPDFVADRLCMSMPYILVDNPMSYAGGREDYGYPKAMGRFAPANGLGDPLQIEAFGGNFGVHDKADWHPLLEVARVSSSAGSPAGPSPGSPHAWHSIEALARELPPSPGEDSPSLPGIVAGIIPDLIKALLKKRVTQVFLKQFRDAETAGVACYQKVVEAPVQITSFSLRPSLEEWRVTIHPLDTHPIGPELGVTNQTTRFTFSLDMEMIAEPGVVVAPLP
jgi:hypothetical protein